MSIRLLAGFGIFQLLIGAVLGAQLPAPSVSSTAGAPPPPPLLPPPQVLTTFRELLEMGREAREAALAKKSEANRKILTERLKEFDALSPEQRQTRLRLMQLRWELLSVLRASPTNRALVTKSIPIEDRGLINDRLSYWDRLAPDLQKWVLENEGLLSYFVSGEARSTSDLTNKLETLAPLVRQKLTNSMARWVDFTPEQQQKIYENFRAIFGLDQPERKRIVDPALLRTGSEQELKQIQKVIESFQRLSREQREQCMAYFRKFTGMTMEQRVQFLRNAERWEKMSETEKEAWRRLVNQIPSIPPFGPPLPPQSGARVLETNFTPGGVQP